jgi:DNA-binding protein H-NS
MQFPQADHIGPGWTFSKLGRYNIVLKKWRSPKMPLPTPVATIHARIRALEKQARQLERSATKGLRAAATVINKHGLSLSDLKQALAMSKGRGKRGPRAGQTVAPKYRDDDGNTWTGRGRPPLWLVAAEKSGKKRESFLIGAKKTKPKPDKPKKATTRKSSPRKAAGEPAGSQAAA